MADAATNRALVVRALTEAFIDRDAGAIDRYWAGENYIQHQPQLPNGTDALKSFITSLGPNIRFEFGKVAAEGDIVMVQSRHNLLTPEPAIAVNIFRIENGRLAEHWEVLQAEVPADKTVSGNPMFAPA